MERDYYNEKAGRPLEASDIAKMEQTLFLPALKQCVVFDARGGKPIYYMHDEPVQRDDGLEYRHSFFSTLNTANEAMQYTIFEEAAQSTTLDQLGLEEHKMVQSQYLQWYIANGERGTAGMNSDKTWQALYEPIKYANIKISIVSSKSFVFNDGNAHKTFLIERKLQMGSEQVVVLDRDNLTDKPDGIVDIFINGSNTWPPEEVASISQASHAIGTVTTKDMANIVGYFESLGVASSNDRDKFVREV